MRDFMCDLETLGLKDNSVIVSIGLVEFDQHGVGRTFYCNVSPESCVEVGLVKDTSTVLWWDKQSEEARAAWQKNPLLLADALKQTQDWLCAQIDRKQVRLWGNGAGFDNVLLRNAYLALGVDEPWMYYHNRCFRTMRGVFELSPEQTPPRVGTYHNALDDALTQTAHLQAICRVYGIRLS